MTLTEKITKWVPLSLAIIGIIGAAFVAQHQIANLETNLSKLGTSHSGFKTTMTGEVAKLKSDQDLLGHKIDSTTTIALDLVAEQQKIQGETNAILTDIRIQLAKQGTKLELLTEQQNTK